MDFPRCSVGGVSVSRMIAGTNWLLGWSHTGAAMDKVIKDRYPDIESFQSILDAYLSRGVDTIMGPISSQPVFTDALKLCEDRNGRGFIIVDTPVINVDDTPSARAEAAASLRVSAAVGAKICLIHHASAEQLVNKNKAVIERIGDYTDMIRQNGMVPGLSAHMPELIIYSDANSYDVETYIQIFNCMGFMMQVEVETVAAIIHRAKKPVMTIKSMAAGRTTPYIGLTFSWSAIRPCDMVTVGAFNADQVHEDVEISLAALERRFPNMDRRGSPAKEQAAFGAPPAAVK